ncbi:hypothetical protein [uncultured Croceitalea sp.]|uniref:hypothetical protein n=1 Tax=uncultured Croceitalea sp. TaxID=1798908 RepID=UPI003305BA49
MKIKKHRAKTKKKEKRYLVFIKEKGTDSNYQICDLIVGKDEFIIYSHTPMCI